MAIGDGVSALATLGVTFGGFSPTAMDGVAATREYVERMEELQAQKREARKRQRDLELARTSKPRTQADEAGNQWTYVVVDGSLVRIVGCHPAGAEVHIPGMLEDMPVYALGPDVLSRNDDVCEIVCDDGIEFIGSCAFRFCSNLRKVVFPASTMEFSASWLSHCQNLEELVLPGKLAMLDASVLDNEMLKRLSIGAHVQAVAPGAFQKTHLEEVTIDSANPYLSTDGVGIYSSDGTVLHAIARPVTSYEVKHGCLSIGKKAAAHLQSLEAVALPEGVCLIDDYAFAHAGLASLAAPQTLAQIGQRAFFHCKQLECVLLNEGLEVIDDSAFEESALRALHLPASITAIGNSVTANTPIVHAGPGCTLTIDDRSPSLFLDGQGGLYRREDDGVHMVQLVDRAATSYTTFSGADYIDDHAFAYHPALEQVRVAEGTRRIGKSAFRCCGNLREAVLPESLESLGDEAFLDTELTALRIPRNLTSIGSNALVTQGAHHGEEVPSLRAIEVGEGNARYFMKDGMLCRREDGFSRIVMFTSSAAEVAFPEDAESVEAYAFNNARGIERLEINARLKAIGTAGLTTWCWIERIVVKLAEPLEGRTRYEFHFPDTRKGVHGISIGIGGASWVNVPGIMAQFDNCVASAHDYNSPRNPDSIPIYDQAKMVVGRLKDPVLLTDVNRSMYERLLRNYIVEICVDVSRHDDRALIDDLMDMGFVNGDNLEGIISAVGKLQDAAMTGYLLEAKRRRFNRAAFDFDL